MKSSEERRGKSRPPEPPQAGPSSGEDRQHGEGNYKATRDYDRGLKEHLQTHDVEREARDAAPRTPEEERQMRDAERVGRSKARDGEAGGREDRPNDRGTGRDPVK